MASKKIDELTNLTSLDSDDLLVAYDISELGDEKTKKISSSNLKLGFTDLYYSGSSYLRTHNTGTEGGIKIAPFGAGLDIVTNGAGTNQFINSNGDELHIRMGVSAEAAINVYKDGAVELFYDGTKKFETISGGVQTTGDGIFTGSLTVGGNLTVTGTQFIANVEEVQVEDNLILLNKNETGAGVTAGTAGLEVERGTATNYKFLFDEPTDTFRIGMEGSLQAVATREDAPTNSGVAYWNDSAKRMDTSSVTVDNLQNATKVNGVTVSGTPSTGDTFIYNGSIFVPSLITRPNIIINGSMNVWQRNTTFSSISSNGVKLVDRFKWARTGTSAVITASKDAYSSFGSIAGEPYRSSLKVEVNTADASVAAGDFCGVYYDIEGIDIVPMIGRVCTLSFTSWHTLAGTYCISFSNIGFDRSLVKEYTAAEGTWEKHTITFTMHDTTTGTWDYENGRGLFIMWVLMCGSTYQTTPDTWQSGNYQGTANQTNLMATIGNKFYLTNVKLEIGNIATRFESTPISKELVLCQRYYEKSYRPAVYAGTSANEGRHIGLRGNGSANWFFPFSTTKRISGGVTIYDPGAGGSGNVRRFSDNNPYACSLANESVNGFEVNAHSSILVGETYGVQWVADVEI